jgi:hypothetical protein
MGTHDIAPKPREDASARSLAFGYDSHIITIGTGLPTLNAPGTNGQDFKILPSRVRDLNIEMSADRHKSLRQSLISICLDGNTEAAFSAELMTAVSTEIGMGFVPISIRRQAMNRNPIPAVALRAVLLKGVGKLVWIVAHRCSPPFQAAE